MSQRTLALAAALLMGSLSAVPALGQSPDGRGFRSRSRSREFTPEERERMFDRIAEHRLEDFTSDYALTAEQQELARAKLEELKAEQKRYAGPLREESSNLHREMHDAFHGRREGREVDEQRLAEIRTRLSEMWRDSPMMNRDRVAEAIEALLPEDQVEQGRQRRAQRQAEMDQRRESWQRRGEDTRPRRGERGERGERRNRGPEAPFAFGDSWDRYVGDFIRRYQLDPAQQATAQSILGELKKRRDDYREAHREDFEALGQTEDRDARRQAYAQLNEPVDQLYSQLQNRLARIPTSAQFRAAERSAPTSGPASSGFRAAGPDTRPAGDRSRGGRSSRRGR